jgi:hypothetical protein
MHKEHAMTLLTLMQAGPTKAHELFVRLSETSDGAVKTRERLLAELKTELERHVDLEERHLFPILKTPTTQAVIFGALPCLPCLACRPPRIGDGNSQTVLRRCNLSQGVKMLFRRCTRPTREPDP